MEKLNNIETVPESTDSLLERIRKLFELDRQRGRLAAAITLSIASLISACNKQEEGGVELGQNETHANISQYTAEQRQTLAQNLERLLTERQAALERDLANNQSATRAYELSQLMGLGEATTEAEFYSSLHMKVYEGIPVSINGQEVPLTFMTTEEQQKITQWRQLQQKIADIREGTYHEEQNFISDEEQPLLPTQPQKFPEVEANENKSFDNDSFNGLIKKPDGGRVYGGGHYDPRAY